MFSLFQGCAHGTEMPMEAAATRYSLVLVSATALLHSAGPTLGIVLVGRQKIHRLAGVDVSIADLAISLS
ncbi:HupE/UreJ family protein [Microvirga sp. BT688]|nr:HupE/UreJ family protein [Microvirga sp.]